MRETSKKLDKTPGSDISTDISIKLVATSVPVCVSLSVHLMRVCVCVCVFFLSKESKVHPRTGHECPELYSFFNLGARWGWVVNDNPWTLYPWGRDPVTIL